MKVLVVGAGFAGAVVAREMADAGHEVLVIDKRNHVAGNAYDFVNERGIRVHKYGPHLWHGSSDAAQDWASRFTEWVPYKHWVRAQLPNGKTTPLPINLDTIYDVFSKELVEAYGQHLCDEYALQHLKSKLVDYAEITNSRQHVEASVGKELCELFFAPYTKKMWGMDLSALPTSVAARIPTKTDHDPFYFPKDKHQYLPKDGYTEMFKRILKHPKITVSLSTRREELPQFAYLSVHKRSLSGGRMKLIPGWKDVDFDAIFTSEPIDVYYDCDLGELPWRSIKFHTHTIPLPKALDAPVVNFTHDGPYTRVTEWKQLPAHGTNKYWTTLTFEEPCDYKDNNYERYYPVKTSHEVDPNRELYKKYRERARDDGIHFIGRCGKYVYTDMIPCVNSTLAQIHRFLEGDTTPTADD